MSSPPELHFNTGLHYHKLGDFAAAERFYREALRLHPAYSDAWNNLGILAQNARNHIAALDCYMTALRHNPKFTAAWGNLGALFEAMARIKEAVKVYEIGLSLDPNKAEIWSNLAGLYRELGQFNDSYRCYEKAVVLGGENLIHIFSAWVFTVEQDPASTIEQRFDIKRRFREHLSAKA